MNTAPREGVIDFYCLFLHKKKNCLSFYYNDENIWTWMILWGGNTWIWMWDAWIFWVTELLSASKKRQWRGKCELVTNPIIKEHQTSYGRILQKQFNLQEKQKNFNYIPSKIGKETLTPALITEYSHTHTHLIISEKLHWIHSTVT